MDRLLDRVGEPLGDDMQRPVEVQCVVALPDADETAHAAVGARVEEEMKEGEMLKIPEKASDRTNFPDRRSEALPSSQDPNVTLSRSNRLRGLPGRLERNLRGEAVDLRGESDGLVRELTVGDDRLSIRPESQLTVLRLRGRRGRDSELLGEVQQV